MFRLSKQLHLFPAEAIDVGSHVNRLEDKQTHWTEVSKIKR